MWMTDSMDGPAYFAERAARCRQLAASVADDRVVMVLLALAEKYEALVAEYAHHTKTACP